MKGARSAARAIEAWFGAHGRELPWRTRPRDPWASLVSELMLQQTQAARVAQRFPGFMARFPSPRAMADAGEDAVLAAWSGLGYYRRARMLCAAARRMVDEHGGRMPTELAAIRALPGVGAYTAGAVASIALSQRTPLVDANVARVLLRLEGARLAAADPAAQRLAWSGAGALVEAAEDPAALNEGLMELGALVCTPRSPRCEECPLARRCVARREGAQGQIPSPKAATARKGVHHACVVLRRRGRLLVEQRPASGLWAGLWQPPTLESVRRPAPARLARRLNLDGAIRLGEFTHATTHRAVRFSVWEGRGAGPEGARWVRPSDLGALALSTPHRRILTGEWSAR